MPAATVPKNALSKGAGYLYYSALGGSLPAYTVAGSVFTDVWPGNWFLLGVTREGHEFVYDIDTDTIDSAEYLDPLETVTTGRTAGIKFELMQVHATNLRRALNGGTLTTSGAGATLRSTYKPPQVGAEIRCMIGWESTDNTERLVAQQSFQVGSLSVNRKKGADNASLPVEFRFEPDINGDPFLYDSAGTLRG
jgi:hypothetical protein